MARLARVVEPFAGPAGRAPRARRADPSADTRRRPGRPAPRRVTIGHPPRNAATGPASSVADITTSSRSGRTSSPDLAQQGERQVGLQVPLVELVEHDGAHRLQERVGEELAGQDALGHEAEPRRSPNPPLEPDLIADLDRPSLQPRSSATRGPRPPGRRSAAAGARPRCGCAGGSSPDSRIAAGSRVVLPEPGGATTTSEPPASFSRQSGDQRDRWAVASWAGSTRVDVGSRLDPAAAAAGSAGHPPRAADSEPCITSSCWCVVVTPFVRVQVAQRHGDEFAPSCTRRTCPGRRRVEQKVRRCGLPAKIRSVAFEGRNFTLARPADRAGSARCRRSSIVVPEPAVHERLGRAGHEPVPTRRGRRRSDAGIVTEGSIVIRSLAFDAEDDDVTDAARPRAGSRRAGR